MIQIHQWDDAYEQRDALRLAIQAQRKASPHSHLGVARNGKARQRGWTGPKTLFDDPLTHELRDWLVSLIPEPVQGIDAWGFVLEQGDYVQPHNHLKSHRGGRNAWAGVYYVRLPQGSGRFSVEGPHGVDEHPEVSEGTAIVFPATMEHWVTVHEASEPRVSIAWSARAA